MSRAQPGVTLLELILVLALLGVILAVVGLAPGASTPATERDDAAAAIATLRQTAIRERHPTSIDLPTDEGPLTVTAFPDGRVVTDFAIAVDPLTGKVAP